MSLLFISSIPISQITAQVGSYYNTINVCYVPKTMNECFYVIGLFAKNTEFLIQVPTARVIKSTDDAENYTKIKAEITHHDD